MVGSIFPLRLNGATVAKRSKVLVGPVDLELEASGITAIMGPNGSGKTTLLRLMNGLERAAGGTVKWSMPEKEARNKQAFVFQTPIMLRRSVLENLIYPLQLQNMKKPDAIKIATEWLERVNLLGTKNMRARFLSGGEKQKLAIARALITRPQVLFLDEPTANLDGGSTKEIEMLIKDASANNVRIIITTHDIGQCRRLSDDVVFLYRGKLHERGAAKSFFTKPKTKEAKLFLAGEIVE